MPSHSAFTSQLLRLQWQLAAYDLQRKLARFVRLVKGGYNRDQPRVPAGSPEGGQWTSEGGGGGSLTDVSAQSRRPQGHHYVIQSLYKKLPLRPETRKVFEQATTGKLGSGHAWSRPHQLYNEAVEEQLDKFLAEKNIGPGNMTPEQAREFVDIIKHASDPRIRTFNYRIMMREIRYWLLRMPRSFD